MFKCVLSEDKKSKIITFSDGKKVWYKNNLINRVDGPAVEYPYKKEWWINGYKHRIGAPAVVHNNGETEWWLNGERYDEEDYKENVSFFIKVKNLP